MAYVRRSPEEEEALQQQPGGPLPPSRAPVGGAAGVPGGATPGAAPAATGPAKGSGYVGLDAYAKASGNAGRTMADTLAGRAEGAAQRARYGVDMARDAFTASAAAGAGPNGYTGPESMDDFAGGSFSGAQPAAQKAYDGVTGLSDWQGRTQALQQAYGGAGRTYSQGAQRLDSALAGDAGAQRFAALQQQYVDLPGAWGEARKQGASAVDAAKASSATQGAQAQQAAQQAQAATQAGLRARQEEQERKRRERNMAARGGYTGLDGYGEP